MESILFPLPEELMVKILEYTDEKVIENFCYYYPEFINKHINYILIKFKLKYPFLKFRTDYKVTDYKSFKKIWNMEHYYDLLGFAPFMMFFSIEKKNNLYKLIESNKMCDSLKFHCANNLNTKQIDYLVKMLEEIEYSNDSDYIYDISYSCYLQALEI